MKTIEKNYRRFRAIKNGMDQPWLTAVQAFRAASILTRFQARDDVRIIAEPETENYFDVYGKPDDEKEYKAICESLENNGCYCVQSEYQDENGEWQLADSIGMCVYDDPCSPWENCYVVDLMESALNKVMEPEYNI